MHSAFYPTPALGSRIPIAVIAHGPGLGAVPWTAALPTVGVERARRDAPDACSDPSGLHGHQLIQ